MTTDPLLLMGEVDAATSRLLRTAASFDAADLTAASLLPAGRAATCSRTWPATRTASSTCSPRPAPGGATDVRLAGGRTADIETGSGRPADAHLDDLRRTADLFAEAVAAMPADAWAATVQARKGPWPAALLVWGRLREIEVHHLDLGADYRATDWSPTFAHRLLREAASHHAVGPTPPSMVLRLDGTEHEVVIGDRVGAPIVTGPVPDLAAWLIGRADGARSPSHPTVHCLLHRNGFRDVMTYSGDVTHGGPPAVRELDGLTISKLSVGPMDNNAYLLRCTGTGDQVLIDAANEAPRLLELIGDGGLAAVVTTHQHMDHWVALEEVAAKTGARALVHADDAAGLPIEAERLADGDTVAVGDCALEVIHIKGTPGLDRAALPRPGRHPHLFTGDSLFPGGVGNTDKDPERFAALIDDVEHKLFDRLPDDTWFYRATARTARWEQNAQPSPVESPRLVNPPQPALGLKAGSRTRSTIRRPNTTKIDTPPTRWNRRESRPDGAGPVPGAGIKPDRPEPGTVGPAPPPQPGPTP
ncbi:maleylpyruvate isomerase family mycothiol-dependent enzyme [Micromonospora sp. M12]